MSDKPIIGVISDRRLISGHPFHMVGEKYLEALVVGADSVPLGIPVLDGEFDLDTLLERVDGLFLTGSVSNVEPHRYQGPESREGTLHDPERDDVAFSLIPAVLNSGMPLLAVCRGFQEMNVACGGTLHQHVHEVEGYLVHREDPDDSIEDQYGPAHRVDFSEGGLLRRITGCESARVNSLHSQAVDRLGKGLRVEAVAEDGLIEAFVIEDTPGFNLSVQWHPEWRAAENPVSMAIYGAFGEACRAYAAKRF